MELLIRMLVELKLRQQNIAGALELWEWYRGAPLRMTSRFYPTQQLLL